VVANMIDMVPSLEMLSLGDACREFGHVMNEQLDMQLEASNLKKFNIKFQKEKWALFPKPIEDMVRQNILVETLMEGTSIANFMNLKGDLDAKVKKLKVRLSDMGSRAMIKMIFFDNFVHGDMHPGNILVQITDKGEPKLVFLDCGIIYQSKSVAAHRALVDISIAFMQHDGRRAARLMIDNTQDSKDKVKNAEAFMQGVQDMVNLSETQKYFEHIGDYVTRICDLAREHQVKLDPGYFHVAMALKVAEGISLSLDKDIDLISQCLPVIIRAKALQAMGIENFSIEEAAEQAFSETFKKVGEKKKN